MDLLFEGDRSFTDLHALDAKKISRLCSKVQYQALHQDLLDVKVVRFKIKSQPTSKVSWY
jgi:hypothetical protein